VVASICRHGMNIEAWPNTRLWEHGDPAHTRTLSSACEWSPGELPVLYSRVDEANWTLVTTRRIRYSLEGQVSSVSGSDVVKFWWGDFKGPREISPRPLPCQPMAPEACR
jgi:hypothetical protein